MTALVPTNIQLPAHLASRIGSPSTIGGAMTAGIGGASFKRISKRGGRFRIRDGSAETVLPDNKLRAVIVGASPGMTKTFYKKYDPSADDKKPDCYSNDGIRPAADAEDQQSQLCANCEQNVWGSKMSDAGTKMKACSDQKRLAIISADDESPEPEVYLYTVTPAELTAFRTYGNLLASKGFPPELVVTELTFDTDASFPKVEFKFGGFVEEHKVPVIDSLIGSQTVREITGEVPLVATIVETPKAKPHPVKTVKEPEVEVIIPEVIPAPKKGGFGGTPVKSTPVPTAVPIEPPAVESSKLKDDIQDILNSMQEDDND